MFDVDSVSVILCVLNFFFIFHSISKRDEVVCYIYVFLLRRGLIHLVDIIRGDSKEKNN